MRRRVQYTVWMPRSEGRAGRARARAAAAKQAAPADPTASIGGVLAAVGSLLGVKAPRKSWAQQHLDRVFEGAPQPPVLLRSLPPWVLFSPACSCGALLGPPADARACASIHRAPERPLMVGVRELRALPAGAPCLLSLVPPVLRRLACTLPLTRRPPEAVSSAFSRSGLCCVRPGTPAH